MGPSNSQPVQVCPTWPVLGPCLNCPSCVLWPACGIICTEWQLAREHFTRFCCSFFSPPHPLPPSTHTHTLTLHSHTHSHPPLPHPLSPSTPTPTLTLHSHNHSHPPLPHPLSPSTPTPTLTLHPHTTLTLHPHTHSHPPLPHPPGVLYFALLHSYIRVRVRIEVWWGAGPCELALAKPGPVSTWHTSHPVGGQCYPLVPVSPGLPTWPRLPSHGQHLGLVTGTSCW